MDPPEPTLDEVLRRALDSVQAAETPEDWSECARVLEQARAFGRAAFDAGVRLLGGSAVERQLGCELIGTLCNPDEEGWSHEAALAIVAIADGETDPELCCSIAAALGTTSDPVCIPVLVGLAHHPDSDVRWQAAIALSPCSDTEGNNTLIGDALIGLSEDEDERVRDWATFGLGQQLDADSLAVRQALYRRLDDPHDDTRFEALVGLARRRDPRALSLTQAALRAESVFRLVVDAAGYLANPVLLPDLLALRDWWDVDPALLESAIAHCDPQIADLQLARMTELSEALQPALDAAGISLTAALWCEVLSTRHAYVAVGCTDAESGEPANRIWDFDALMQRAGGVTAAVAAVIADIGSRPGPLESPR